MLWSDPPYGAGKVSNYLKIFGGRWAGENRGEGGSNSSMPGWDTNGSGML